MTVQELTDKCRRAIADPLASGEVSLLVKGKAYGETKKVPGLNIKGKIVCEYSNTCLCVFDAKKLLEKLEKAGVLECRLK